jgi:hypothetical protein
MTSTAYRQSSRRESAGADADDAWYGRFSVRRLDAEALRDRVLCASGRLDPSLYGRSVPVTEDSVGQVNAANDSPRRSVYLEVRRTEPVSFLTAFDAPVMMVNCDRRVPSTSATQSLMLMNSDFVLEHAKAMARRLRSDVTPMGGRSKPDLARMIDRAWRIAYQRAISSEERAWASEFASGQLNELARSKSDKDPELAVLTNLCQQLLTSNEFLYVD